MELIAVIPKQSYQAKGYGTIAIHAAKCQHQRLGEVWCEASAWESPSALGEYAVGILSGMADDGVVHFPWKAHYSPCVKGAAA